MIREKAVRNESLDRSNARDLEQVVRTYQEVDVSPVSPSSTNRMRAIAFRNGTLENSSQCEEFETKEKERETFCGCFGKRTPFL